MSSGQVLWFTGLSGSGKTTVANGVRDRLESAGFSVLMLDGDDVRRHYHRHLDFSEQGIKTNNALIAQLCVENLDRHDAILVPIISPYRVSRAQARESIGHSFHEIHFSASLECVVARDTKGLYAKARDGELKDMIGYAPDRAYEPPSHPALVIDSERETETESIGRLFEFVRTRLRAEEPGR